MPAPVYLRHRASLGHDTGAHPEQAARIPAIEEALGDRDWLGFEVREAPDVPDEALVAIHPRAYVDAIEALCARGGGLIDADTVASPGSWEAARRAAGGAVALVDSLMGGEAPTGFNGQRPPGHHAESARAMGFCLFNTVAVAARRALDAHGAERVLVLDWDVHHGNGTNDIFHAEPRVLFCSIHQSPLYPGTGAAGDVGSGTGEGYTVNLPVAPGSGDEDFAGLVAHVVAPLLQAWRPELVLVSAGYDAHRDDPLADCRVTEAGYAAMAALVRSAAAEAGAPVGVVLEGGYDLGALARSVVATLEVLGADDAPEPPDVPRTPLVAEARRRVATYWDALAV